MAEYDDMDDGAEHEDDAIDPGSTLAKLMAENAALKDQAMRYAAEAENTRRRAERESNDARAYAIQKFARDLLDASDNLSRAVQHAARGDKFDPHMHQAVTEQPAEGVPPGGVVQVLQAGYELFGRIVRPAMVAVTPKGAGASADMSAEASATSEGANPYSQDDQGAAGSTVNAKA